MECGGLMTTGSVGMLGLADGSLAETHSEIRSMKCPEGFFVLNKLIYIITYFFLACNLINIQPFPNIVQIAILFLIQIDTISFS